MADGNLSILSFERARRAGTPTQPVAVIDHPMAAAFGFAPVEDLPRERVEVTAGHTKVWATRVDGMIWAQFDSATLALRCAENLRGLIKVGALFPQPPTGPEAA